MNRSYFERLHVEELRRADWRLLDEALRTRPDRPHRLRVRLGRALIALGARLADEPTATESTMTAQPCQ